MKPLSGWSGLGTQVLSTLALLLLWQLLAESLHQRLLPGPQQVGSLMWSEWQQGALGFHLLATLKRVALSFGLAMLIGSILGILMGRHPRLNRILDPLLVLLLNIPALVIIILFYIWLGLEERAAIAAVVINKIPTVVVTLRQGTWALDPQYQALARVYRLGPWRRVRDLLLPQLAPYFLVSARSGLALIWKIVLVVELLGRSNGVGFQLYLAFQMFDVPMILAYSFSFILIVQGIEWLILQPWERFQRRWQIPASA